MQDKWRNMSVSASGQGSREKFKAPKLKALLPPPSTNAVTPSPLPAAAQDAITETAMDSSKSPADGKAAPRCVPYLSFSPLLYKHYNDFSIVCL